MGIKGIETVMRNAFIKELTAVAREHKDVMLLTGDLGFKVFDDFIKKYPKQFMNIGVAEANMVGIAAGLALEGLTPFTYSIAPFATLRCYEQIRNDVCFHEANVKIVAVGGGYSYGPNGPTHHALMDIAIMRVLPGMTVLCPGDPVEAACATRAAFLQEGPVFIRLGRSNETVLHSSAPDFKIGKGLILKEGNDVAIVSTGNMLEVATQVADQLTKDGISPRVVSMHTIKPLDINLLRECFEKFGQIFTLEEHSILGGLGSAVSEAAVLNRFDLSKLTAIGAPDTIIHTAGSHNHLRQLSGLTTEAILKKVHAVIKTKQALI